MKFKLNSSNRSKNVVIRSVFTAACLCGFAIYFGLEFSMVAKAIFVMFLGLFVIMLPAAAVALLWTWLRRRSK